MQKHWVWLATRSGIGVRGRAELLRRFGTAERIYAMDRAALQAEEGLRQSWLEPLLEKRWTARSAFWRSATVLISAF